MSPDSDLDLPGFDDQLPPASDEPGSPPVNPQPTRRTETAWPMLQALLDEALLQERGLRVPYDTWAQAESVRNSMGKLKRKLRDEAIDNATPYDALRLTIRPRLKDFNLTINWTHTNDIEVDATTLGIPIPNLPRQLKTFASACTIEATRHDKTRIRAVNAPSFAEAWKAIHRHLPADLLLERAYDISTTGAEPL